jgi:hypothetical protein
MAEDNYERTKKEAELREQIAEAVKESTKNLQSYADAQKIIAKNYKLMKELSEETARNEAKINELLKKSGGILTDEIKALQKINEENRQQYALYQGINKELSKTKNLLKSVGGSILDGAKALKDQFIPSLSEIFQKFLSIDHLAHQTANTLGFQGERFKMMAENLSATREEFAGMGFEIESAYKAQSALSDATGRQVMLTREASKAMAETARITGMEVEDLAGMTGEMELFGLGAQQATSLILDMSKEAANMGLNSGQVIKKFQQNLGLLNKLNFKAGVKGLKEMAKFSEKYKIDMQDVAAVADKVFRPEGAIEAAAQLQVLGGDLAALGDPFQLMYKARNAPEELAKSITKAATASATFNEKTGEFEVNAYELDRMREAASALGMDYSKLVETAKQGAKVKKFEGLLGGKGLDDETMEALTGAAQMGENGAFVTIKGEPKLLKDLTKTEADLFVTQKKNQAELAQQAMSVQANFDAIKNKIMLALVNIFEKIPWDSVLPVMKNLGEAIVGFIGWFSQNPWVGLGTLLALYFGPKIIWPIVQGLIFGKTAGAAIGTAMTAAGTVAAGEIAAAQTGGGAAGAASGVAGTAGKAASAGGAVSSTGGGVGGSLTSLAGGLSAMGTLPGVALGAVLLIPAAIGLVAMVPAIPSLLFLGKVNLTSLVSNMDSLALGLSAMGTLPGVGLGALLLIPAGIGFAAMTLGILGLMGIAAFGAAAGVGLEALGVGLSAFGATAGTVGWLGVAVILALSAAFIGFSYGVTLIAEGIATVVNSLTQMFTIIGGGQLLAAGLGFMAMATGIGVLTISLIALGAASLLALPGLLILGGVTSMLTETASALASTGGGEGISKTINAINSVDEGKLEALKDLSMWMALAGASPTITFDESLHVEGTISLSGKAGGKTDTDWVNDPIFVSKLKQLISDSTEKDKNGGKAR